MLKRLLPTVFLLIASPAFADIPPPPGAEEAWRGELVRKAGFACEQQPKMQRATSAQEESFAAKEMVARVIQCSDGGRYLVATPRRRYGAPNPNAPPPPEPVVQKLD